MRIRSLFFIASIFLSFIQARAEPNQDLSTITDANEEESGAKQFAVVCLRNESGIPLNYTYRWGNGAWQTVSVPAGRNNWFSWRYSPDSSSSPHFEVQFDYDLRPGRNSKKTYSLVRYQAQFESCEFGKQYRFTRTGNFVDLYSIN